MHSLKPESDSKLCYDRWSVGQSVLGSGIYLESMTGFLLLLYSFGCVDGRPLSLEEGSVDYNCYWSSPAQSFLCPSPQTLVYVCIKIGVSFCKIEVQMLPRLGNMGPLRFHCKRNNIYAHPVGAVRVSSLIRHEFDARSSINGIPSVVCSLPRKKFK
jgi:hypothetical protein